LAHLVAIAHHDSDGLPEKQSAIEKLIADYFAQQDLYPVESLIKEKATLVIEAIGARKQSKKKAGKS
jgi:hypothetical protein